METAANWRTHALCKQESDFQLRWLHLKCGPSFECVFYFFQQKPCICIFCVTLIFNCWQLNKITLKHSVGQPKNSSRWDLASTSAVDFLGVEHSNSFSLSPSGDQTDLTGRQRCKVSGHVIVQWCWCTCVVLTVSFLVLGYGHTGPMSQRAGYDAVASAISGLMHITGPEVGILPEIILIFLFTCSRKSFLFTNL